MQLINGITFSMLFILAIIGLIIFVGFNIYRRLILPIILLKETGPAHQKSLVRLEIVIWAIYFVIVLYHSLVASMAITLVLLTLILFAFFDFWINYFSGIILKFGGNFHIGDSITVNEYSGKILEFGNRDIKLVSSIGEELLIPYRLVNKEVKIGQKSTPKILFKTFVLEEALKDDTNSKQKMEKAIYKNPWIIISSPVNIVLEGQRATLSFYVLNNDFFEKAKRHLLKQLS